MSVCQAIELEVPDFSKDPARGSHTIPLAPLLYIERSDFMEDDGQRGFRRLTPSQPVGLKYTSSTVAVQQVVKVRFMSIFVSGTSVIVAPVECGV